MSEEREPLLGSIQHDQHDANKTRKQGSCKQHQEDGGAQKEEKFYIPRRYILVFLFTCGTANSFAIRVNFNVALLAMVNDTESVSTNYTINHCPGKLTTTNSTGNLGLKNSEFDWSPALQSSLLAAFFYGYPLSQPVSGLMAEKFGAKKLLVFAGLSTGCLNMLMPILAQWNVYALIMVRALIGICLGPVWPAMIAMIARWTLQTERTKLLAICNAGFYIGTMVSQSISGILCSTDFLGGWPSSFYLFGVVSLIWGILFLVLTADTPAKHPSITWEERNMIEANTGDLSYRWPPFKAMLTSLPIWSFLIVLFMDITAYDIVFTYLPLYMKRVLKFNIAASGGLSSIPYVLSIIVTFIAGYTSDVVRNRQWLSTMWTRRVFTIAGDQLPAVCVLIILFLNCDRNLVVFFFILTVSLSGFNNGGFVVNMFDLAPRYAGTIYGFINGFCNLGGMAGPLLVGVLTDNSSNVVSWHSVFYMVVGIYTTGVITFCVFGSVDLQPWAEPEPAHKESDSANKDNVLPPSDATSSVTC